MAETKKKVVAKTTTTTKKSTSSTKKATTTSKSTKSVKAPAIKTSKKAEVVKFEAKLPKEVFGLTKIYEQAMFDTILSERASKRIATHKVKSRAEVSGTGKKPWPQKGTGNARAGSLRSPIFVGGGRAFGPNTNRNYNLKVNKKVRRFALLSALTLLAKEKAVLVKQYKVKKPSTRDLLIELSKDNLATVRNVLLVSNDENIFLSARNLPNVNVVKVTSLTVEALVAADVLVLTNEDVKYLESLVK